MSTWKFPLLLLDLSLLAVSINARQCKTLFFFTTISYYPIPRVHSSNPNPNFSLRHPFLSPLFLTFFFTTAPRPLPEDDTKFRYNKSSNSFLPKVIFFSQEDQFVEKGEKEEKDVLKRLSSMFLVELYLPMKSLVHNWTKDIMGVMGSMLFGTGCSALTTAIMYLIWSLFFDDSDDDDDDDASPKKMGYVVIPNKFVDDDLKKPAKEIV